MSASGLMVRSRALSASTFTCPTVSVVAMSWRLMLVSHTESESTRVMWRMPVRTRLSAHQLPTPPTPNTMTRLVASTSMAGVPNRR